MGSEGAVEAQGVREELEEGDVVPHEASGEEGGLFGADGGREDWPDPSSQEFGK